MQEEQKLFPLTHLRPLPLSSVDYCLSVTESLTKRAQRIIPDIGSSKGIRSSVVIEKNGGELYKNKIEITAGIPDHMSPGFRLGVLSQPLEALTKRPRLLISYLIGIDKWALGLMEIRSVAILIESSSW